MDEMQGSIVLSERRYAGGLLLSMAIFLQN